LVRFWLIGNWFIKFICLSLFVVQLFRQCLLAENY
jgi:hypothetical protein